MSGFLDHLFDPQSSGKKGRERIRYREKLRTLIHDAPAVRRLTPQDFPHLITAISATEQLLPTTDLVVERVGESASADRFRDWKTLNPLRPIFRLDPVETEEQVLESRAMGADAFTLVVGWLDLPMLQFLLEVGRDYGIPAILSCQSAEDLALALKVQDGGILWLRDEVHTEALFDLEALKGRHVIYETREKLELNPSWVCGVIQLFDDIPLPPTRERKPAEPKETLDLMEDDDGSDDESLETKDEDKE